MSLRATTWALYEAPKDIDAITFRLLMIIADNCDENGCGFAYSTQKLADLAGVNKRTVQNRLPAMVNAGLIRLGNQSTVAYLPANKRPKVYDLVMAPAQHAAGNTSPMPTIEPANNEEETSTESSNNCSTRGETNSPQTSKNFAVRGERGVNVGCTWGERMHSPKTIETIETIETRESTRSREIENPETDSSASASIAKRNRTDVRTSVLGSTYDPTADEQARMLAFNAGVDLLQAFETFQDYYAATGKHLTDWGAKFHLWLRREKNFSQPAALGSTPARKPLAPATPSSTRPVSFTNATGIFADRTRRVLNDPTLQLTLNQKKQMFDKAINIMIQTQSEQKVLEFVREQAA